MQAEKFTEKMIIPVGNFGSLEIIAISFGYVTSYGIVKFYGNCTTKLNRKKAERLDSVFANTRHKRTAK